MIEKSNGVNGFNKNNQLSFLASKKLVTSEMILGCKDFTVDIEKFYELINSSNSVTFTQKDLRTINFINKQNK